MVDLRDPLGRGGNTGRARGYLRSDRPADRERPERAPGGDGAQPRRLLRAVFLPSRCKSRGQAGARPGRAGGTAETRGRCFEGRLPCRSENLSMGYLKARPRPVLSEFSGKIFFGGAIQRKEHRPLDGVLFFEYGGNCTARMTGYEPDRRITRRVRRE